MESVGEYLGTHYGGGGVSVQTVHDGGIFFVFLQAGVRWKVIMNVD